MNKEILMGRRDRVTFVLAAAFVLLLFGLQAISFAATRTVVLNTPGCV
jgi:preprotein translocase subunit SecG